MSPHISTRSYGGEGPSAIKLVLRAVLLLTILGALGAGLWQYSFIQDQTALVTKLDELFADHNARKVPPPKITELDQLILSSSSATQREMKPTRAVYEWRGSLMKLYLTVYAQPNGIVVGYDREAPEGELAPGVQPQKPLPVLAKPRRAADPILPIPGKPDVQALEHLAGELARPAKIIPEASINTITTSEYRRLRSEWYRDNWVQEYVKHADRSAPWFAPGQKFLEEACQSMTNLPAELGQANIPGRVEELLQAGCTDPLLRAVALRQLALNSPHRPELEEGLKEKLLGSGYPAHLVYWAAFPWLNSDDYIQLQIKKHGEDRAKWDTAFNQPGNDEQRFLFDHFQSYFQFTAQDGLRDIQPLAELIDSLLKDPQASPWIRDLLLAEYCMAGGLDDRMRANAILSPEHKRKFPGALDYEGQPVTSNDKMHMRIRRLTLAKHFLLQAWHYLPRNPEAAARFVMIDQYLLSVTLFPPKPEVYVIPGTDGTTFVGEGIDFWTSQALHGQADSLEVLSAYLTACADYALRLSVKPSTDTLINLARECLETGRFDTRLPYGYLLAMQATDRLDDLSGRPRQERYSRPDVHEALSKLLENYRRDPREYADLLPQLKSYVCCTSYLAGDIRGAVALLDELGDSEVRLAFARCQVSAQEVRDAGARMKNSAPFDLGPDVRIMSLRFADAGKTLWALDLAGQVCRLDASTGAATRFPGSGPFLRIAVDPASQGILALTRTDELTLRSPADFSVRENLGSGARLQLHSQGQLFRVESSGAGEASAVLMEGNAPSPAAVEVPLQSLSPVDIVMSPTGNRVLSVERSPVPDVPGLSRWTYTIHDPRTRKVVCRTALFNNLYYAAAFSDDGDRLAVIGRDTLLGDDNSLGASSLCVVDTNTGETLLRQHLDTWPMAVAFVGNQIALAVQDREVRLLDQQTGALRARLTGFSASVLSLAVDFRQGRLACAGDDGRVQLYDLETLQNVAESGIAPEQARHPGLDELFVSRFHPLVHVRTSRYGTVWTVDGGRVTGRPVSFSRIGSPREGAAVAFDQTLVTWSKYLESKNVTQVAVRDILQQKELRTFSFDLGRHSVVDTFNPIWEMECPARLPRISLHPGGRILVMPDFKSPLEMAMLDLQTGQPIPWSPVSKLGRALHGADFSDDGRFLATTETQGVRGNMFKVTVWTIPDDPWAADAMSGQRHQIVIPRAGNSSWRQTRLSRDGRFLATTQDLRIDVYRLDTGAPVKQLEGLDGEFSPAADQFCCLVGEQFLDIYDTNTFQLIKRLEPGGFRLSKCQWRWDGKAVVFEDNGWIRCLDVASGKPLPLFTDASGARPIPADGMVRLQGEMDRDAWQLFAPGEDLSFLQVLMELRRVDGPDFQKSMARAAAAAPLLELGDGGPAVWNRVPVEDVGSKCGLFRVRIPPGEPRVLVWAFDAEHILLPRMLSNPGMAVAMQPVEGVEGRPAEVPGPRDAPLGVQVTRSLLAPGREYVMFFNHDMAEPFEMLCAARLITQSEFEQVADTTAARLKVIGIGK